MRALVLGAAFLFGSGASALADSGPSFDRDAFLRAIAEVETGGNPRAIGSKGERGLYQFNRVTWRQYTRSAHHEAHNPGVAYSVAVRHFDWLHRGFERNGREATPYMMAAAWNGGLKRALSGRMYKSTRSYAARVSNIVAAAKARAPVRQVASEPPAAEEPPTLVFFASAEAVTEEIDAIEITFPILIGPATASTSALKSGPAEEPRYVHISFDGKPFVPRFFVATVFE